MGAAAAGGEDSFATTREDRQSAVGGQQQLYLTLTFDDVSYTVGGRKGRRGPTTKLLDRVSGALLPGQLTAVMGSSGGGKTTLLNVLACSTMAGSLEGSIRYTLSGDGGDIGASGVGSGGASPSSSSSGGTNGTGVVDLDMRDCRVRQRVLAYCEQHDDLLPYLTVREHLLYYARLLSLDPARAAALQGPGAKAEGGKGSGRKSSGSSSGARAAAHADVDDILATLGLTKCANVRIGTPNSGGGISGGQRRRCTMGLALLARTRLLLLDEPTSGLDAYAALEVVGVLRGLADQGLTVATTIHQPSAPIWRLFDACLLLVNGSVAYFGEAGTAPWNAIRGSAVLRDVWAHAAMLPGGAGRGLGPEEDGKGNGGSGADGDNPAEWLSHALSAAERCGQLPALLAAFQGAAEKRGGKGAGGSQSMQHAAAAAAAAAAADLVEEQQQEQQQADTVPLNNATSTPFASSTLSATIHSGEGDSNPAAAGLASKLSSVGALQGIPSGAVILRLASSHPHPPPATVAAAAAAAAAQRRSSSTATTDSSRASAACASMPLDYYLEGDASAAPRDVAAGAAAAGAAAAARHPKSLAKGAGDSGVPATAAAAGLGPARRAWLLLQRAGVLLHYRGALPMRSPGWWVSRFVTVFIIAVLSFLLYARQGAQDSEADLIYSSGMIFVFCIILPSMSLVNIAAVHHMERGAVVKEAAAGLYTAPEFFAFRLLSELPVIASISFAITGVGWGVLALRGSFPLQALSSTLVLCESFLLVVLTSAVAPSARVAILPYNLVGLMSTLTAGYLIPQGRMPWSLRWYTYVNWLRYPFIASMTNFYGSAGAGGQHILAIYGVQGESAWANLGYAAIFAAPFALMALMAVCRSVAVASRR